MKKLVVVSLLMPISYGYLKADNPIEQTASSKVLQIEIPAENKEGAALPSFEKAEELAKALAMSFASGNLKPVHKYFFPEAEFLLLKNMPGSAGYYKQLVTWYKNDLDKELKNLATAKVQFKNFKPGRCSWKKIGSEYNHVAYWSCKKSQLVLSDDKTEISVMILTMINWGKDWYITHLGPIPR